MKAMEDYKTMYKTFRKIPLIRAIIVVLAFYVWSIADVVFFSDSYRQVYGIMQADNVMVVFVVWLMISIVPATIVYFYSAIAISPIVVQTDTLLEINAKLSPTKKANEKKAPVSGEKHAAPKKNAPAANIVLEKVEYIDTKCPHCGKELSFDKNEITENETVCCPYCECEFNFYHVD